MAHVLGDGQGTVETNATVELEEKRGGGWGGERLGCKATRAELREVEEANGSTDHLGRRGLDGLCGRSDRQKGRRW